MRPTWTIYNARKLRQKVQVGKMKMVPSDPLEQPRFTDRLASIETWQPRSRDFGSRSPPALLGACASTLKLTLRFRSATVAACLATLFRSPALNSPSPDAQWRGQRSRAAASAGTAAILPNPFGLPLPARFWRSLASAVRINAFTRCSSRCCRLLAAPPAALPFWLLFRVSPCQAIKIKALSEFRTRKLTLRTARSPVAPRYRSRYECCMSGNGSTLRVRYVSSGSAVPVTSWNHL
jgi:hypothetical protein